MGQMGRQQAAMDGSEGEPQRNLVMKRRARQKASGEGVFNDTEDYETYE